MRSQPPAFVDLTCGRGVLRLEASLAEMATQRAFVSRFTVEPASAPLLTVHRVFDSTAPVIEGPLGSCRMLLEGDVLSVEVGEGPFLGELVLRLAWYIATVRQGGLLIHAAAVRHGARALVACGKSGDGKSTLSRLCVAAGLTLMTDEVVQLFPDGTVAGTPFRSDPGNAGTPGLARAEHFVALEKAPSEELKALKPSAAVTLVLSQRFDLAYELVPVSELRRRALQFLSQVALGTLAFRKDAAAGPFVAGLLGARER